MEISTPAGKAVDLKFIQYEHSLEAQYLPAIRSLISKDLSEPYSIYVYRYFLCQWSHLCFMVSHRPCHQVSRPQQQQLIGFRPWTPRTPLSSAS